ncbi:hypothetical protein LWI28_015287 [Acer negundo]|uniref:Uncharacterized protein n=1 Tax=Acer negundo TaxID=4023 RepID=A0AAD5IZU5_ACENE|nr:hypothetical protein LWI28_015287 [Acer negundo]KAK4849204.1 hypothetical protein QYF36_022097 [Acer negundo]
MSFTAAASSEMKRKFEKKPTLLGEKAGKNSCCIFRVPRSLMEINQKAYHPLIVSIGPYHHGAEHLTMIEEHKRRFVRSLLDRTGNTWRNNLDRCFGAVVLLETEIRECYSETNRFGSSQLIEMMVVDGCFIIELVWELLNKPTRDPDDPIFKMDWILPFVMRDLLKLENQIPYFVLEKLFEISVPNPRDTLQNLILRFFSFSLEKPGSVRANERKFEGKHLLDLVRKSFQPQSSRSQTESEKSNKHLIQPAKKLDRAGIKFETRNRQNICFLDVKFSNGVFKIPPLRMDDFITCFILNCVAFEQCYGYCEKFVTDYATLMGCLINNQNDASFLSDHKIIENYYGTDEEVTRFFEKVCKDVAFDLEKSYLYKLIEDVNQYYWNDWHVRWASFKHTYFDTPWSFMSALAALILLVLTMIQAFMAYYAYVHPPKQSS